MGRHRKEVRVLGRGSGGGNRMGRTLRRLECWERVRCSPHRTLGRHRKEVRVPGEGQVGGTGPSPGTGRRLECSGEGPPRWGNSVGGL